MLNTKPSLCIFIHFSKENTIPNNVLNFVNELSLYFDEVALLANKRELNSIPIFPKNVKLEFQENIGYDLGRFYKFYNQIAKDKYRRIACINDSNIIINHLSPVFLPGEIDKYDFWGIVDSYEKPWFSKYEDSYHLQSHFLIFNEKAIELLNDYFETMEISSIVKIQNQKKLRRKVIEVWEIGLTQLMISKNLKLGHFIDSKEITNEFNIPLNSNITISLYKELLLTNYPLIKKKALLKENEKFPNERPNYLELLKKYGNPLWDLETIAEEINQMLRVKSNHPVSSLYNKIILFLRLQVFGFNGQK